MMPSSREVEIDKYEPFDLSKKEDRDFLRDKWVKSKNGLCEIRIDSFDRDTRSCWRAHFTTAASFLEKYTFLDGSPVGKKLGD